MFDALMGIFQTSPPDGTNNKFKQILVDIKGRLVTACTIGGVAPQLDDTNKVAVSLYGKDVVAGDKAVNVSASGNLEVDVKSTVAGSHTDDDPFTAGSDDITVIGGFADMAGPDSVDEGDAGALRMTLDRKLLVALYGKDSADGDVPLNANSAGDLEIDLVKIKGVSAPQLDDTDKIAVSLYGKDSASGDKELNVSAAGNLEVDLVAAVAIALAAGEAHVGEVGGKGLEDRDSFVRPANTDIYTAADVIAADTSDTDTTPLRSLALARISGGSGWLTSFMLTVDHTAFIVRVRVHLFTGATPPTALAGDNAPFAELAANVAEYIDSFDLPTTVLSAGAGADMVKASRNDLRIPFVASDANIYYRLETLDADTPANAATFRITARSDVD